MIFNTVTPFKRLLSRTGTQTKGFTFTHACMQQQQQLQGSNLENIMEWQSDCAGMVTPGGGMGGSAHLVPLSPTTFPVNRTALQCFESLRRFMYYV